VHRLLTAAILLSTLTSAAAQPDPFSTPAKARVLLFVRTDCPLTNRYAPELRRIAQRFSPQGIDFWLVYPDRTETATAIEAQIKAYGLPGKWTLDPNLALTKRAEATTAPEAAVFNQQGALLYHGRIDNRWVDFGKARPAATEHDLEDALISVLAGKPPAHSTARAIGCALADVE
jgi:Redoxin